MKINIEKSKVMLFNAAKSRDISAEIKIKNEKLEVVEEMKLLGVEITTILRKEPSELVSWIYLAQKTDSLPGDYYRLVEADLIKIEFNLTESQILSMTPKAYKNHIK